MRRNVVVMNVLALALAGACVQQSSPALAVAATSATGAAACTTSALATTLGASSGAAGTIYWTLIVRNRSRRPCRLAGIPSVQPVRSATSRVAVGPPATVAPMPGRGRTMTLRPNARASVVLGLGQTANYPTSRCRPMRAEAFVVTFRLGGSRATLVYSIKGSTVCTKLPSTRISGVAAGVGAA